MVKKAKPKVKVVGLQNLKPAELVQAVKDSAQQIWMAGLGSFSKAQAEGGKVFATLVKEGKALHSKTRKAADAKVAEVVSKTTGGVNKLEKVFDDRVARALAVLGVPSRKEVDALAKRVADLSSAVKKASAGKAAKAAAPAAAKKPAPRRKAAPTKPAAAIQAAS